MITRQSSVKKISLDYHKYIDLVDYLQLNCSKSEYLRACKKLDNTDVTINTVKKD